MQGDLSYLEELSLYESSTDCIKLLTVCIHIFTSRNSYQAKQVSKTFPMHIVSFNAFVTREEIVSRLRNNYYPDGRLLIRFQKDEELTEAKNVEMEYIVFDNDEIEVVLDEEDREARRETEAKVNEDLTETKLVARRLAKKKTTRKVIRRNPTIRAMQESVRRWRNLKKKKCNFKAAAEIVGIPKKTLDDYHTLIKTGLEYNFNFQSHCNDRIGVLRKFIMLRKRIFKRAKGRVFNVISC
eukprot:TRINITY_DN7767_c0_g1_i3.p1 TRINITY_DN7767_c0_g1~~TRINITY_DN7767_c0_g1_i3.p1  ORF type:complete len:240 (-),score=24.41 TRINITY_DN7767_c0_g1_i3:113-832(-)